MTAASDCEGVKIPFVSGDIPSDLTPKGKSMYWTAWPAAYASGLLLVCLFLVRSYPGFAIEGPRSPRLYLRSGTAWLQTYVSIPVQVWSLDCAHSFHLGKAKCTCPVLHDEGVEPRVGVAVVDQHAV